MKIKTIRDIEPFKWSFSIVLIALLLLFSACEKSPPPYLSKSIEIAPVEIDPVVIDPDIALLLDSLEFKVWEYFISDPDSAEIMLYYTIDLLDSLNLPQLKFYAYMHLAQHYQYRKPDAFKTIEALGKAVRIFVDYPGSYTSNASVYIDIGNFLFRFKFFDEAINLYQLAYNVATYSNDTHLQAVALQNIALAYSDLKVWDSAIHYVFMAGEHISQEMDLLSAQNNNYLAEIYLNTGQDKDVSNLLKDGLNLLDNATLEEIEQGQAKRNFIYRFEISANAHRLLSQYYFSQGDFDHANEHLSQAIWLSEQAGSSLLKAKLYFAKARQKSPECDVATLILDTDSAMHLIFKLNEPSLQQAFADTMLNIFSKRNILPMQEKYALLSKRVADSISKQKASSGVIRNIMLVASIVAEQAVQKLQVTQLLKNQTIRRQKALIISVIAVSLIVLGGLIKIYMQKQKITLAHQAMVQQIKSTIDIKENQSETARMNTDMCDNLDRNMERLMKSSKPYLNSKLTLSDLAGKLNTNQTYLSNFLNRQKNISFTDYINQLRVKEACRQLLLPKNSNLSVDALAAISGFNSKSTFYTAFRKVTGMTPAEFQKSDQHPETEN